MANFVLDTGVVLGFVRGAAYAAYVEKKYAPSKAPNLASISVVTVAEIQSFALRRNWAAKKQDVLAELLRTIPATPIRQPSIIQKLWNYCNILRDDGLSYGDYVEQLTFLLFLKMAVRNNQTEK